MAGADTVAASRRRAPLGFQYFSDGAQQGVDVDRFDQVRKKAGLSGAFAIARLPIARYRDEPELSELRERPQAARELVAVEPRQSDVEQRHVRTLRTRDGDRLVGTGSGHRVVAEDGQELGQKLERVGVVVDD
ncbi:MAG TPA: hypothetical protein VF989_05530 [Polyangiaceae bacterium]|jgi:hypothetical protein